MVVTFSSTSKSQKRQWVACWMKRRCLIDSRDDLYCLLSYAGSWKKKRARKYFDTKRCGRSEKERQCSSILSLPASRFRSRRSPSSDFFFHFQLHLLFVCSAVIYIFFSFSLFKVIIQLKTSLIRNIIHGAVINIIHRAVRAWKIVSKN